MVIVARRPSTVLYSSSRLIVLFANVTTIAVTLQPCRLAQELERELAVWVAVDDDGLFL